MKVLLATDLSEAGLRSVEGLCACGASGFRSVTLLHVVDLDLYTAGGSVPGIADWAESELEKVATYLRERGFEVDVRVEIGPAVETITSVGNEIGAELLVVTNLGSGAAVGRLLGSTAERLAGAAGLPVLIERVGHDGEQWCRLGAQSPFSRVLLGVDLEDDVPGVVARALGLPGIEALRVVHVVHGEDLRDTVSQQLDDLLAGVATSARLELVVAVGGVVDQLLEQARDFEATVIAVTTCRHGMLHRGVLGSVARSVTLGADGAVLLLPPA